jgi:hypothetical protein
VTATQQGRHKIGRFLDWLLGERCPLGCGQRVFPADLNGHLHTEHAGGL